MISSPKLRRAVALTVGKVSDLGLLRKLWRGPTVLTYHGVENQPIDARVQRLHTRFAEFEKQIDYLGRNFEFISADDLLRSLNEGRSLEPRNMLLTFDDGYRNLLTTAAPFLHARGIPFTAFVSTAHVDQQVRFPIYLLRAAVFYTDQKVASLPSIGQRFDLASDKGRAAAEAALAAILRRSPEAKVQEIVDEITHLLPEDRWEELNSRFSSDQPLDWAEVAELATLGATIGSHCHRHMILHSNQDNAAVKRELSTSKALIENHVGECAYFAYPNGGRDYISWNARSGVREAGYQLGFTSVPGQTSTTSDLFALPRIGAGPSLAQLRFRLNTAFRYSRAYDGWRARLEPV